MKYFQLILSPVFYLFWYFKSFRGSSLTFIDTKIDPELESARLILRDPCWKQRTFLVCKFEIQLRISENRPEKKHMQRIRKFLHCLKFIKENKTEEGKKFEWKKLQIIGKFELLSARTFFLYFLLDSYRRSFPTKMADHPF